MKSNKKTVIWLVCSIAIVGAGYQVALGRFHKSPPGQVVVTLSKRSLTDRAPANSTLSNPRLDQLELEIDRIKLSREEANLKYRLLKLRKGKLLARLLISGHHSTENPEFEEYGVKALASLKSDPKGAIESIQDALELESLKTTGWMAAARASLLVAASELPGQAEIARELALKELVRDPVQKRVSSESATSEEMENLASTADFSFNRVLTAHYLVVRSSSSEGEMLRSTIDAIQTHQDTGLRLAIAQNLFNQNPTLKDALAQNLLEQGVLTPEDLQVILRDHLVN